MQSPEQRGIALLFIVLIIGSVSLGSLAILARGSVNGFVDANNALTSLAVRAKVMGCLDETLIQLQKENGFAPATVATGSATCTLAVTTPLAGQRLLVLTLADQGFTRSVRANVTLSPFVVTQINEP